MKTINLICGAALYFLNSCVLCIKKLGGNILQDFSLSFFLKSKYRYSGLLLLEVSVELNLRIPSHIGCKSNKTYNSHDVICAM